MLRAIVVSLVMCNCQCGELGHASWATAGNLVMPSGPLRGMKPYTKNVTISSLWAIVQDLVMPYGLSHTIWLFAMGHSAKPISTAQNYTAIF